MRNDSRWEFCVLWGASSCSALRNPFSALPKSEPNPLRRRVPNNMTTMTRMIASFQVLKPNEISPNDSDI